MTFSKRRGRLSTFLISLLNPALGLLWIGRWRLALLAFVIYGVAVVGSWVNFSQLTVYSILNIVAIALVLRTVLAIGICFLMRSTILRWYSNGLFLIVVFVFLVAFMSIGIRTFAWQPFEIPSGSMAPTLVKGDNFFASKLAYDHSRYSAPYGGLPISTREPKRGDVVVFFSRQGDTYVKRVVGLPGEKVQMINGILSINENLVQTEATGNYELFEGLLRNVSRFKETLPNGISYSILSLGDDFVGDNTSVFIVPTGEYFLLGDNRDNSDDSRFSQGTIPFENIIGKAEWIFWNSEGIDYLDRQFIAPKQGS